MRSYEELETEPRQFQEHTYRVLRDLGACSLALQWVATWAPANEGETYGEYLQRWWRKALKERGAVDWAIWLYCKAHFRPNDYNSLERRYLAAVFCRLDWNGTFEYLSPPVRRYLEGRMRTRRECVRLRGTVCGIALGDGDISVSLGTNFRQVATAQEILRYFPAPPTNVFIAE